jgi:transposase-like protein
MADEQRPEEVQRWTAKRRAALVLSLLKGETTAAEAARRHGLKVAEVEDWRDRFLLGAENALRGRVVLPPYQATSWGCSARNCRGLR